ncbi:GntR family transcriptional regulator [Mariniflexile jejuense]|uniref:GntR family transcriptional regulator n=1 Tax=Mariniflexile jejuense TaxID=1173582 RepID=A0ABW3JNH0_9FLAO
MNMLKDLKFENDPNKFKYQQIVDCFMFNISNGNIKHNETVPSINEFSRIYNVSRDTVEKAYKVLKKKNIISARKGKSSYVSSTKLISKLNILFLINKFSAYKLKMYNSFIESIGDDYHVDVEIYNCDESLFLDLLDRNLNKYDYYVIMPHFKTKYLEQVSFSKEAVDIIKKIPREKLVIMDNNQLSLDGDFIEIYQDFEKDIYNALLSGIEKINKYNKLILRIPKDTHYPFHLNIINGFMNFCTRNSLTFEVSYDSYDKLSLNKGDLFIVQNDDDLVNMVDLIGVKNLTIGKDIGVISYNETPLKRLLGITVISTDFQLMGRTAAQMIINNKKGKIKNPFNFICRNSI